MKRVRCLLGSVVLAMLSTGCSTPRAVTASLPPPAVCLMRCETMAPLPRPGDNLGRVLWELQAIDDHANCAALLDACADQSMKRMKDQSSRNP